MFRYVLAAFTLAALFSCKNENKDYAKVTNDATVYHGSVKALTDVIVHDIFLHLWQVAYIPMPV